MSRNAKTKPEALTQVPVILLEGDRFVAPPEAARILDTTVNTLNYKRTMRIGPKFYKQGRAVRYLLSDLIAWATANPVEPEARNA